MSNNNEVLGLHQPVRILQLKSNESIIMVDCIWTLLYTIVYYYILLPSIILYSIILGIPQVYVIGITTIVF